MFATKKQRITEKRMITVVTPHIVLVMSSVSTGSFPKTRVRFVSPILERKNSTSSFSCFRGSPSNCLCLMSAARASSFPVRVLYTSS